MYENKKYLEKSSPNHPERVSFINTRKIYFKSLTLFL